MKRAVVTGAAGMIGSALVNVLTREGIEVIALVNPDSAREVRVEENPELVRVMPLALDGYGSFAQCAQVLGLPACDVFFHLAWRGTIGSARADEELQQANVASALDAVRLARVFGCSRFVGVGSQAEHGALNGPFGPDTPTDPVTPYGKAKLEAGTRTRELAHELGLEHVWARVGSVYGPGDSPRTVIMQAMAHAASGEPFSCTPAEQPWDHIYCDDAARALALLGERGVDGRVYPIGTGVAEPLRAHIEAACKAVNPAFEPSFGAIDYPQHQVMHLQADIAQLSEDTRFEAQATFDEGIRKTAEWFVQQPALDPFAPQTPEPAPEPAPAAVDASAADTVVMDPVRPGEGARKKTISILIPCFNEEDNVAPICQAVTDVMERELSAYDYEIVFIDNCSKDLTRPRLRQLCAENPKVKAIFNVKNFGQFNSPYYGLTQTSGDCAICLCADFQDPPELIPRLVVEWERGAQIVSGIKTSSREGKVMYLLRTLYYKLIHKVSDVEQIQHFTGFGLYDRSFIDVMRDLHDPTPFLRGIVAELGGKRVDVEYEQAARRAGKTHNNWYTLYDAAMLSFTSYTKVPLRIASIGGFVMSVLFFVIAIALFVVKLVNWHAFAGGQASILMAVLLIGSVLLFFLGLLGEYVMAMSQRVMDRPLVVEQERINFGGDGRGA